MARYVRPPDTVTSDYIEAHRLGVCIRTPIENVAFFKAEHKAVVAYTKGNGEFMLQIPLWVIEEVLKGKFMHVHRSYLVQRRLMPGLSTWRTVTCRVFEIKTTVKFGDRIGITAHTIPVARRLNTTVRKLIEARP